MRHLLPTTREAQPLVRRGFTLIEMMVVIGIIVLMLAMAVPAFRYITGSRSVDSAQNLVAAMLGRARAQATHPAAGELGTGSDVGVFFMLDTKTDRTTMALVQAGDVNQYKTWAPNTNYAVGDVVAVASTAPVAPDNKIKVQVYQCVQANVSSSGNAPPNTAYWVLVNAALELVPGTDLEVLPAGVGAQLMNDTKGQTVDRYVHTGVILFDSTGHLIVRSYTVSSSSQLGQLLGLQPGGGGAYDLKMMNGTSPMLPLSTSLGLVLYETEPFRNNPGTTDGWDSIYANIPPWNATPGTYNANETAEEQWLDQNGLVLLVDRGSGALTKAE